MKIAVVGTGYVGLVSGACFAEMGNTVICVDTDKDKIAKLSNGQIPIYEPGLEQMVLRNRGTGTLSFSTSLAKALQTTTIIFIAVGTPMGEDGSADLQYVLTVANQIGKYMQHDLIVVDKSTVPVGTADMVKKTILEVLQTRKDAQGLSVSMVSNPEFLKEGSAINDFMKPDRIIVGADNEDTLDVMRELYRAFTMNYERFIAMDIRSAEMTKYSANAMLATKISFMNEIANICEHVGADANMVRKGIGSDSRIGYKFIYPGCGYGGSCFPKDIHALRHIALAHNYNPKLITAVEEVNHAQKFVLVEKIKKHYLDNKTQDLSSLTFAIWGLSFKPGTDDMREAPATIIIKELITLGAKIYAYDPQAMNEAKNCYLKDYDIKYCTSKYDTLNSADAMILITEWKEFRSPDFGEIKKRLNTPVIFDGRNQYDKQQMQKEGFRYYQIGNK